MAFSSTVEQWRAVLEPRRNGIPIAFLLAWLSRESGGNPCSTGFTLPTKFEAGIGQLMFTSKHTATGDIMDAVRQGVSLRTLRAPCSAHNGTVGSGGRQLRPLTDDEKAANVDSFLADVEENRRDAQRRLDAAGIEWPEETQDFWMAVKLEHALPGAAVAFYGPAAKADRATTFADFVAFVTSLSADAYNAHARAAGIESAMRPFFGKGIANALANAQKTGAGVGITILERFGALAVPLLVILGASLGVGGS